MSNQDDQPFEDVRIDMGNGMSIFKSAESQQRSADLKHLRAEIRQAKKDKNVDLELVHLDKFQQFHIDNDFSYGAGEIYRYVIRLEKLGMHNQAKAERDKVDNAQFVFFDKIKQQNLKRLESQTYFKFIKFTCYMDNPPEECRKIDGMIEPIASSQCLDHYRKCQYRPRCQCNVSAYKQV